MARFEVHGSLAFALDCVRAVLDILPGMPHVYLGQSNSELVNYVRPSALKLEVLAFEGPELPKHWVRATVILLQQGTDELDSWFEAEVELSSAGKTTYNRYSGRFSCCVQNSRVVATRKFISLPEVAACKGYAFPGYTLINLLPRLGIELLWEVRMAYIRSVDLEKVPEATSKPEPPTPP